MVNARTIVWCFIAVFWVAPTAVRGQQPFQSGRNLFEKEWQWLGPSKFTTRSDVSKRIERERRSRQGAVDSIDELQRKLTMNSPVPFSPTGGDGLGPLYNAKSCVACHAGGGTSGVQRNVTLLTVDPRSPLFRKVTKESQEAIMRFFPGLLTADSMVFHTVVHDHSTRPGYDAIREGLRDFVPDGLSDGWFTPERRTIEAIASRPVVAGRTDSIYFYLSQRNAPALFGLTAIESISEQRRELIAQRQRRDTHGRISGRVAGKFGWRGQIETVHQFVSGACAGELGLNQSEMMAQANDPADVNYASFAQDIDELQLASLQSFVMSLPDPIERIPDGSQLKEIRSGERLFNSIGCADCHVADLRPVSGIFSDLLLHDMGESLQAPSPAPMGRLNHDEMRSIEAPTFSRRRFRGAVGSASFYGSNAPTLVPEALPVELPESPSFPLNSYSSSDGGSFYHWDSMGREWKTPPLWGVADTAPYLHDGRAATLREAILWHGGEGRDSRDQFEQLSDDQQEKIVSFLKSLRSPQSK